MKQKAELPPMTVKELREYVRTNPDRSEAKEIFEESASWYFANLQLITIGEDYAFKRMLNALQDYIK